MRTLYTFGINIYIFFLRIASLFHPKAKKMILGRRELLQTIENNNIAENIIWFHAASVGEFEQARPIIERIKKETPLKKILITFYSPSAYELRKDYPLADYIYYIPFDTPKAVNTFLELVKPEMVFFVKYEFWFNFIYQLHKREIPLYLISGIFRSSQHFFKFYGKWFANHLKMFHHLFVQDKASVLLLNKLNLDNYSISGDTRFDRVYKNTLSPLQYNDISIFAKNNNILLAGSTWPADEKLLSKYLDKRKGEIKLIIAPHEIEESHLLSIEILFKTHKIKRWSHLKSTDNLQEIEILIVDSVGKLMHLYQYANVAYIGGGFGVGIHNILEAACFGNPIVFGPNYHKFKEASDLLELHGAFSIKNSTDLFYTLDNLLLNKELLLKANQICRQYVEDNIGATDIIYNFCFKKNY